MMVIVPGAPMNEDTNKTPLKGEEKPAEQNPSPWTWKDLNGVTRTRAELDQILEDHKPWNANEGQEHGADLNRADLNRANLPGVNLIGANLTGANLTGANLTGARLTGARLTGANLTGADLTEAVLIDANLSTADLTDAKLDYAQLRHAYLENARLIKASLTGVTLEGASRMALKQADLTGADLTGVNLRSAELFETNLTDACMFNANLENACLYRADLTGAFLTDAELRNVTYEPKSNPAADGIAFARNIQSLTYDTDLSALTRLRKQLEDDGFRASERKITYALKRRDTQTAGPIERWFNKIAFDWTCQYGMNPARAFVIWFGLFLVCSVIYGGFIHHEGESGIYKVLGGPQNPQYEQLSSGPIPPGSPWLFPVRVLGREARVASHALYFSLTTAFSLGVWNINIASWLHEFPTTEYELKPKGWARPVAAIQAALSVGLIVLWVLTYFGRPFNK